MAYLRWIPCAVVMGLLAACESGTALAGDESTSSESTGDSGETGTTTTTGSDETGTEGGPTCEELLDVETTQAPITVRIRNELAVPVFVESFETCADVPVMISKDGDDITWWPASACQLCRNVFEGECGCNPECEFAAPIVIAPGGAYEATWDGINYERGELPVECEDATECEASCTLPRDADNGLYEARVRVGTQCTYEDVDEGPDQHCTCEPDETGSCEAEGISTHVVGGEIVESDAEFELPGDVVEILVEP